MADLDPRSTDARAANEAEAEVLTEHR